ncbi:MAG: tetratricopeptide repeat protein [bacterium]
MESYLDDAVDRLAQAGILRPIVIGTQAGLEFGYSLTRKALLEASVGIGENLVVLNRELASVKSDVYQSASPERRSELAASIADHFLEAGDRRASFQWWLTAADHAERAQDFRAALSHQSAASRLLDEKLDPDGDRLLAIRLAQGRLYSFLGEFGPAEYALSAALDEARRVGDTVGEALCSEQLANVVQLLGRYEEAEGFYRGAYKQFQTFGDAEGRLRCAVGLGEISRFKGRYLDARGLFEEAFEIADKKKLDAISIRALYGLGQCEYAAGKLRDAVEVFQKCRKRAEVAGDWRTVSSLDIELALTGILTDGISKSEALANAALEAKRRIGDSLGQAHAHLVLGMILRRSLRVSEAEFHCQRALTLNERLSHRYGIGKAVMLEGEIAWVKGDLKHASRCGNDACKLHFDIQDMHGLSIALLYTGLFEIEQSNLADAERLVDEALAIGGQEGLGLYQPLGLLFLGTVFEFRDNLEEAIAYYGESLQLAEHGGNREVASLAAISLAKLHLVLGDSEAVKQEIPIATHLAEKLGNNIALLFALTGSAWLARLMGHAHELQVMMQKLRVLHSGRSGVNLRIPDRLMKLGHQIMAHQPPAKAKESLTALADVVEGIGDTAGAEHLRHLVP